MMDIVLVSSITGQNISECIDHTVTQKGTESYVIGPEDSHSYCLEDYLIDAHPSANSISQVLDRPSDIIQSFVSESVSSLVDDILYKGGQVDDSNCIAFITAHTVLFHGHTRSFISPYLATYFENALSGKQAVITSVISVHDDIYDIHSRLLGYRQLFDITYERDDISIKNGENDDTVYPRDPAKDIYQQRLLADWRDRELSAAQQLAKNLSVPHFLCHQKGYLDTFWKIATSEVPPVYYSHPISQPRRDWTETPAENKVEDPEPDRGYEFEESCQELADDLIERTGIPLIDPTGIDELRIDTAGTNRSLEQSEYNSHIFPCLSKRWTLSNRNELFDPNASGLDGQEPYIQVDCFEDHDGKFVLINGNEPIAEQDDDRLIEKAADRINGSIDLLEDEIDRQITVRDYKLTYQCPLLVVFRPFTVPLSFRATGGVEDEVKAMFKKLKHDLYTCSPSLIVVHPWEDEEKRRKKAFGEFWSTEGAADAFVSRDDLENDDLRDDLLEICIDEGYRPDIDSARRRIEDTLTNYGVRIDVSRSSSSMSGIGFQQGEDAWSVFLDYFVGKSSEIFINNIQAMSADAPHCNPDDIIFMDEEGWSIELHNTIENALTSSTKVL